MKALKIILALGLLLSFIRLDAQNPYEEFGVTPKVMTLSDGKYEEFFPNDTIVQIGSVMFNTVTNEVVAFVETDTVYSEATMQPEIVSRWLSPDPLSDEFPDWSPYNFSYDSPIKYKDEDGRFPIDIIADVAFIIYDVGDIAYTGLTGKGVSSDQLLRLGGDVAGALIPYATGVGAAIIAGKVAQKVVKAEKVIDKANDVQKGVQKYEVGKYKDLKNKSEVGDELDLHHVPQQNPAKQVVKNYNKNDAPSIALPKKEHAAIPKSKGEYSGTARSQLAKDIKDLRKNTKAPNSSLQELVKQNKATYPDAYKK
jgi:hypothetical protein